MMNLRNLWEPRRFGAVVITSALVLSSGCSIGVDEEPRAWSNWDRFDDPPEGSQAGVERIYLIDSRSDQTGLGTMMTTAPRGLPKGVTPYRGLLDVLFEGPTSDESKRGLKTSIPSGILLNGEPGIEQRGTIVIDLSEALTTALGDNLVNALAQIVWTLCERPEVRQVRILIDGRRLPWTRPDGTVLERPLTPFDFPAFAIASQPDLPGIIEPPLSS